MYSVIVLIMNVILEVLPTKEQWCVLQNVFYRTSFTCTGPPPAWTRAIWHTSHKCSQGSGQTVFIHQQGRAGIWTKFATSVPIHYMRRWFVGNMGIFRGYQYGTHVHQPVLDGLALRPPTIQISHPISQWLFPFIAGFPWVCSCLASRQAASLCVPLEDAINCRASHYNTYNNGSVFHPSWISGQNICLIT